MKGYTEPRLYTPPLRKLTHATTLGYAAIEYGREVLGKTLYPWQEWELIHGLEIIGDLGKEWHFRFRVLLILVARQNGKTVLSEVLGSFFQNVLQVDNIFGTSLSLDKAEEVWEAVVNDQETIPELSGSIYKTVRTNGKKRLILKANNRLLTYKVGAPTRRAGRGDSNDLVLLDELREQRDWDTWAAAANSTNAKPNGMIICFTNAGDVDSVVLRQLRETAIQLINGTEAGDYGGDIDGETLGLFEWSAPDGAATDDIDALAHANPALGYGSLTLRTLKANRQTMPESSFRSECMCQQVETLLPQPFPEGAWAAGVDERSGIPADEEVFYGIDLSQDRRWTSIAACGRRADGNYHIEVIARRVGTEWAIDWFRERAYKRFMNLAFQSKGAPVSGLAEQICTLEGIERIPIEGAELTSGWGRFWDGIAASEPGSERGGIRIFHLPQPVLDMPARTCQLKNLGGGLKVPDRVKSPDDAAPLIACFVAFAAATQINTSQKKIYESAYANGADLLLV